MAHTIDLRSDTVTKPTAGMREAMAQAEVGDDVYGEDPTVNRLEAMTAELLGKEAAVFVSSGTMGNLISVLSHCGRGDEMILGDKCHIFTSEQGGTAALGSVFPRALPNRADGTLPLDEVAANIRGDDPHHSMTRLLCLENTHNRCGGTVLPVAYMDAAGELAHEHGLKLHVDGARLWNAAVVLGVSPDRLVRAADSVSVCLSKGLGAPVGSVVAGSSEFIERARRNRKVVGGAMRQAGVIAAAGIVSITEMVERLEDDHANAKKLAEGLAWLDGIEIDPEMVETNLVFFELHKEGMTPAAFSAALKARNILLHPVGGARLRAVINHHVSEEDVATTLAAIEETLASEVMQEQDGVFVYQ